MSCLPERTHAVETLISVFNATFVGSENTVLVRGDSEPLYLPATQHAPARIIFAHGFFSSALHEIAHWCVAGIERRKCLDLGYWYSPDGRSPEQQREFEQVEVKPQALEWMFSVAAGWPFRVSCDNLEHGPYDIDGFRRNIHAEVLRRLEEGLPARAHQFVDALQSHYGTAPLTAADFALATLR